MCSSYKRKMTTQKLCTPKQISFLNLFFFCFLLKRISFLFCRKTGVVAQAPDLTYLSDSALRKKGTSLEMALLFRSLVHRYQYWMLCVLTIRKQRSQLAAWYIWRLPMTDNPILTLKWVCKGNIPLIFFFKLWILFSELIYFIPYLRPITGHLWSKFLYKYLPLYDQQIICGI